jgi:hypothetical protein
MVTPFGSTLPLTNSPYNSRINENYTSFDVPKNYYLLGFNPGYALQASELNEVQELFYINLNLTQRMNSNWTNYVDGYNIPFWDGMVPLSPQLITFSGTPSLSGSTLTFTVIFNIGWYLWTDNVSKMSFWIYNDTAITTNVSIIGSGSVGFIGGKVEVTCCPNDTCSETQDSDIRDNSQGNTCGASRKNIKLTGAEVRSSSVNLSDYFPVLSVTVNSTAGTYTIKFPDGQFAYITE